MSDSQGLQQGREDLRSAPPDYGTQSGLERSSKCSEDGRWECDLYTVSAGHASTSLSSEHLIFLHPQQPQLLKSREGAHLYGFLLVSVALGSHDPETDAPLC